MNRLLAICIVATCFVAAAQDGPNPIPPDGREKPSLSVEFHIRGSGGNSRIAVAVGDEFIGGDDLDVIVAALNSRQFNPGIVDVLLKHRSRK